MNKQTRQTIDNLKGEIAFREKLSRQHVTGEVVLPDYHRKDKHDEILAKRIHATQQTMQALRGRGVRFSPFLELGAERGQRSLVLSNDFQARGVAIDISYHQLRTMEHFAQLFKREQMAVRVCCDANHLPFKSNAFPFVFCYEFLHHFPSLLPVVSEIYRVLADGYFYFDEEPFKRVLKLSVYRQKDKIYSDSELKKNRYCKLVESFVAEASCDEVEHGIIENRNIALTEWIRALSLFDEHDVSLSSIYNVKSKLDGAVRLSNIGNFLLGGTIVGLCRKRSAVAAAEPVTLSDLFACPDCTIPLQDGAFDRPPLVKNANGFTCTQCGFAYPCRDGIIFLLPKAELEQLYPQIGGVG